MSKIFSVVVVVSFILSLQKNVYNKVIRFPRFNLIFIIHYFGLDDIKRHVDFLHIPYYRNENFDMKFLEYITTYLMSKSFIRHKGVVIKEGNLVFKSKSFWHLSHFGYMIC